MIDLVWNQPEGCTDTQRRHYQRFLYRAKSFHSLFPDWFRLATPQLLDDAEALGNGPFYLNVAGDRKQRTNSAGARELMLEKALLGSGAFEEHFGLETKNLDRQVPVGVFRELVAQTNRIFTGGKVQLT